MKLPSRLQRELQMTLHSPPPFDPGGHDDTIRSVYADRDRAAQLTVAGALVAAITHDLRQPLTALEMNIAAAQHFLRPPATQIDDALEALNDALVQQGRMREALQVLHDLAVHHVPNCEMVDLVPIVRDVMLLVGSDVLARHATVELNLAPAVPAVFGDASLMRQALLNIVLDALEAASLSTQPQKTVLLTVRPVEGAVEVAVTHFGLRTEAAVVDDWGLALARSVVEAHHGTIAMEGNADDGVRLVTRWPLTPYLPSEGSPHA
jgi:two-component system sensor kinase FixL